MRNRWKDGWMNGHKNDGWMAGWMIGHMDDRWMDGWTLRSTDESIDGWTNECINLFIYLFIDFTPLSTFLSVIPRRYLTYA